MSKLFIYYNNNNDCQFYQKHGDCYYLHTKTNQGEIIDISTKRVFEEEEEKTILRNINNKVIGFCYKNVIYGGFNG